MSLDDVTAELVPQVSRVRICVRGDLVEQRDLLAREASEQEKADELTNEPNKAPEMWAQYEALGEEIERHEREFVFTPIGHLAWSELSGKHQPDEAKRKAFAAVGQVLDHDPDTFPPAAMALSCTLIDGEPAEATTEGFRKLAAKLALSQWQKLWGACLAANIGGDVLGKSAAAIAKIRASATNSTTAANGASPARSSSGA